MSTSDQNSYKRTVDNVEELAALPSIMWECLSLVGSPESSAQDLAELIEQDQSLTSKILRVANSAFYGFSRRIGKIGEAVPLLGYQQIRRLVLAISTLEMFGGHSKTGFDRAGLWEHNLGTAVAAELLLEKSDLDSARGFVAGLLHDVGKTVADDCFPDKYQEVVAQAAVSNQTLFEIESSILGVTHPEIGLWVAERWRLPNDLVTAIQWHHDPTSARSYFHLTAATHAGSYLCRLIGAGTGGDNSEPAVSKEVERFLDLGPERTDELSEELKNRVAPFDLCRAGA